MSDNSKRKIEQNKALIEKYPFLDPRTEWDDELNQQYDFSYTMLDQMPAGWRKAFGEMICEEIKQALLKCGEEALQNYHILEIKEKYGQIRWYDTGFPSESRVGDIIGKYSTLSENICLHCGKPDIPMTGGYWIVPLCKECYCSDGYNTEEEWALETKGRPAKMANHYKYSRYIPANQKWEDVEIDISDTAEEIRRHYYESKEKAD